MHPAAFDYHRPGTLSEALDLLSEIEDARALAGGQSLLPAMKMRLARPAALVDIGRIGELAGIARDGDELAVGATTVYADVLSSESVREACPVLAEAVARIGDRQVRNLGTVGGSVAHADPAADLPALLTALDATIVAAGPDGERRIRAGEFFQGLFTTALGPGELVTSIRVPVLPEGAGATYVKHRHPASGYAVVGVAALLRLQDGVCSHAALAVGGVTGGPVLVDGAREALEGRAPDEEAIADAADAVPGALQNPMGDIYASGEYRVHLAGVMARRALVTAAERALAG